MNIDVITGFDGSSPFSEAGVHRLSATRVRLLPNLRRTVGVSEEQAGQGSRLNVRLLNPESTPRNVCITADWETPTRVAGHDIGYLRHETEEEWRLIPGYRVDAAQVEYRLTLPPGLTHLGLYPEFNYEQCERFAQRIQESGAAVESLGLSRESRHMRMISLPSTSDRAVPFLVQARDHAYETAGSYCVAGIADFLLPDSADELAVYLRSKFHFFLVPMTNPDGVYNGLSRLTWEQGADMNRLFTVPDPAHAALRNALDRIRPQVYMNIHNWTHKFMDGLLVNEATLAERIQQHMPADHVHAKRWFVEISPRYAQGADPATFSDRDKSWKNYCKETFGASAATFEFPWFGLNTAAMRQKGKRALIALALAAIEERGL